MDMCYTGGNLYVNAVGKEKKSKEIRSETSDRNDRAHKMHMHEKSLPTLCFKFP